MTGKQVHSHQLMQLTLNAFAKINWTLHVVGKRSDGYHDLDTVFQSISLHDTVELREAPALSCTSDDAGLPGGEANLAFRAALLLHRELGAPPVAIHIRKKIPPGGGLGGGSADAAAVLRGVVKMFGLRITEERVRRMALDLGSDVPFFLVGGRARGTGRGEILAPLADEPPVPLLLAFPGQEISTENVFRAYNGERDEINDLEAVVFSRFPHFTGISEELRRSGASRVFMTGSGSTIVAAYDRFEDRDGAVVSFAPNVRVVRAQTITRAEALAI
jgi:4-diphosphocytidyl-2-C-methyl-D-erythritol kinase